MPCRALTAVTRDVALNRASTRFALDLRIKCVHNTEDHGNVEDPQRKLELMLQHGHAELRIMFEAGQSR